MKQVGVELYQAQDNIEPSYCQTPLQLANLTQLQLVAGLAKCYFCSMFFKERDLFFCSLENAFLGQMFFIFRKYYILIHKAIIS